MSLGYAGNRFSRREFIKLSGAGLAGAALLGAAGCGSGGGSSANKTLTLGNIGWTENTAVSNLTKVLMEKDLGYESVELTLLDLAPLWSAVASGDLHAFQDVWMPNQEDDLKKYKDQVEMLEPWYESQTKYGMAVPEYMQDIKSIPDLKQTGLKEIIGVEPGTKLHAAIKNKVIPGYNLDMSLVESSTPGMLSELKKAYSEKKPIVVTAWAPHWMNKKYNLRYLKDPKDFQGKFNDPSKLNTVVNKSLTDEDPVAYAFLEAVSLNSEELNSLELSIEEAGSNNETEGVNKWLENNREVVQPWVDAAKKAQKS